MRVSAIVLLLVAVSCVSGCGVFQQELIGDFVARPAHMRQMNKVSINWEIREDTAEYCFKALHKKPLGLAMRALNGEIHGCSMWDVNLKTCTVVTNPSTAHAILGHEIRHCFEGNFH